MRALLSLLGNKIFLYIVIFSCIAGGFVFKDCQDSAHTEQLNSYKRQLSGQFSEKERELQQLNTELGISKSQLMSQNDLIKKSNKEKEELDKSFEKFKGEHKLQIKSRDLTIARLKQTTSGGTVDTEIVTITNSIVDCRHVKTECLISYTWEDMLKRFTFSDPNIFLDGNETFTSSQVFKIYGEIYQQTNGSLQVRRLVLREVTIGKQGQYINVNGGKSDIVDSKFDYHNPPAIVEVSKSSWLDSFKLTTIMLGSATAFQKRRSFKFGIGTEFFNLKGFGVNTHMAVDARKIKNIEGRLGIGYRPTVFSQELNVGIGISVGTPYTNFMEEWTLNADLIFYLHN